MPPPAWIAIGIGVGVALGNAFDQTSIGVALGAGLGTAMFAVTRHLQKNDKE